ncbi:protein kinase [Yinghuangia sp. ASG 101]|uniref:protein kinase domain-containing protein n=1 Tax=Yinghuangia sp. ASG 101 TaxID=2896848 RepID=UPI001E5E9F40|nr:protein kinase [Yinghuangia sp. ASG 101]UGQ14497.1 protein kinase [Yinghuangia sp. ASG 101]
MSRILVGRYELVRLLGRGGMGEVWAGTDIRIGRSVAVKLLSGEPEAVGATDAFLREARTAGALRHPGVVTVFDVGQDDDGTLFLVMELVDGSDLARVLRRGGVPPMATAVEWVAQAADALAAAHRAGVVHRDLKPANLMLTGQGTVTVLDFGIARFAGTATTSSHVVGTWAYMPPERFGGHPGDARSDVYSLGCVLYELLTGRPPFVADNAFATMNAHLRLRPAPLRAHRAETSRVLDDLVGAMLAKDPAGRPATADEVRDRLRALAPVVAPRVPVPGPLLGTVPLPPAEQGPVRRGVFRAGLVTAVAVATAVIAAGTAAVVLWLTGGDGDTNASAPSSGSTVTGRVPPSVTDPGSPAEGSAPTGGASSPAAPQKVLTRNDAMTSPNGDTVLRLQVDGNLVVYHLGEPTWAADNAWPRGWRAVMQQDGDFVLFDEDGDVLWSSGTGGHPGATLDVRDDGSVVIVDRNDTVLWAAAE